MIENWIQTIIANSVTDFTTCQHGSQSGALAIPLAEGCVKISGPDCTRFLQGQLSIDTTKLGNRLQFGAYCNIKGRVNYLFWAWQMDDAIWLRLPQAQVASLIDELQPYARFSKVTLEDISACFQAVVLMGTGWQAWLQTMAAPQEPGWVSVAKDIYLGHTPLPNSTLLWTINPAATLPAANLPAAQVGPAAFWHWACVTAGWPVLDKACSGAFLPHGINLPALGAIDFNKGCFRGQEIIARMQHRGKLTAHLYHVHFNAAIFDAATLTPGQALTHQNNTLGTLVHYSDFGDTLSLLAIIADRELAAWEGIAAILTKSTDGSLLKVKP